MEIRRLGSRAGVLFLPALVLACMGQPCRAGAQVSLPTAVNLALQHSPRVKVAQADLDRARAVLTETRDAFVPSVGANAGVGKAVGAPLSPPVVFSIAAQSLVFSFSQPDYIRSARTAVTSAQLALDVARTDVSEDTTNTYITLDNAQRRGAVLADALDVATRLVQIVEDRYSAGVDPHVELTRAQLTAARLHLQQLEVEDEIASSQEHLAALTGLPAVGWKTVPDSIPELHLPSSRSTMQEDPNIYQGVSAAFAAAQARWYTAHGDKRGLYRPQISFSAQYSRLVNSIALNTYSIYYPGFFGTADHPNSINSLSAGVEINLPLLDMVRRAKAHESAADAAHALFEAQAQQATFIEGREKLRHSARELQARAEVASLDHALAQDDLDALTIRLRAAAGNTPGQQSNPKDEENARLAERQRTLDMLSAELQLHQAEVTLMRQEGSLSRYLAATIPGASAAPAGASPDLRPVLPPTNGFAPGTLAPSGTTPAPAPTNGTLPGTLPSAPVANPSPSNPPAAPSSTSPASPSSEPGSPRP